MSAVIEIRSPGVPTIRREIGAETLVIGRRPRDVQRGIAVVQAQELSDEHLIVSLVRDRFHLALGQDARIEPHIDGKPFKQLEVPFGAEIKLGSLAIRFTGEAKKNAGSPVIVIAALAMVAFVVGLNMLSDDEEALDTSMPPAPGLFEQDTPCPYGGVQALSRANETEQAALAHAERYSFDPHDGIAAVHAYRLAASCYTSGGDAAGAARAKTGAQRWQQRLETSYQGHQLRLRLALDRQRMDHVLSEVRALKKLLRGKNNQYVTWLSTAERRIVTAPPPAN